MRRQDIETPDDHDGESATLVVAEATSADLEAARPDRQHLVEISVNERAVSVDGPHSTGFAIKEAAIAQGVPIELDFVLSEEEPGGRTRIIGDEERVIVHPKARFHAVAPDDNS
jgi:hypothetical protein